MIGIKPKFSTKVENLCNSSTSGIMLAYSLIKSGLCNAVLVTGTEKQDSQGNKLTWDMLKGTIRYANSLGITICPKPLSKIWNN